MKIPTLAEAIGAIDQLGEAASAAAPLVNIVVGLFTPQNQQQLKDAYARQMGETDAALDRLEQAARDARAAEGR